jgi:PAS domain S-box-containing protein
MVLQQETVRLVLAVSAAGSAAVFAGLARYAPRIPGPAFWGAASACMAFGFACSLLPDTDWHIISLLFNIPFAASPALLLAGLQRFYGVTIRNWLVQLLIAAGVASTLAFTFLWPETLYRIAALSLVVVVGYGCCAAAAWREPAGPGRIIARLVAATFLAIGLTILVRAAFILVLAPAQLAFAPPELGVLNSITWIMDVLVVTLSAPMLVLAVAVRLLASLEVEKQRTEASEAQFRELATSAGVGIFVTDADGMCTYANPGCSEITGLPEHALSGVGWKVAIQEQDLPEVLAAWRDAVQHAGRAVYNFRVRRPTGEIRWVRARPVALPSADSKRNRFLATIEDITGLRNSYERIRELAQRLETVREDERRSVAHALHEGVAQDLVAATLDLNRLRAEAGDNAAIVEACNDVAQAIDKCIGDLRELTNSLRPGTLAHLPLVTAVSQYARQFAERSGLRIDVTEGVAFPRLGDAARLVFFRAAQEALTNVARHARATHVTIALEADNARLSMTVSDDGVGIGEQDLDKPNALGLLGIQERFTALGGGLSVRDGTPRGTVLTVFLPTADL